MKEIVKKTGNKICVLIQQEQVQAIINIIQLSIIGIVSYILLLFKTEHIKGLGQVIIFGILFYVIVYFVEWVKNRNNSKKKNGFC